ncbi:carboxypeptidase-like regulatory domain-containing protein [bacterium]|nr:carboxypeptidase-like regulatory domain-containing protein [bacterium]
MRNLLLFLLLCLFHLASAQEFFILRGFVYNEDNQGLPGVFIRVQNTGEGVSSDEQGRYELRLQEGLNRIVYSYLGYESQSLDIVMDEDKVQNIWLQPSVNQIEEIAVRNKRKDYSYEVMQNVIDHKDSFAPKYNTLKYQIYIKSKEDLIYLSKKEEELQEESLLDKKDSIPKMNLYEAEITYHYSPPNKFKEEKSAAKALGSQYSLFYKSTTEGDFDIFDNLIVVRSLSDNSFVSPISNTAFVSYKFKLLGSYYDGTHKVYRIKVIPRKLGNALFKGEIEVYDEIWAIKSIQLEFPKRALIKYDEFSLKQEYGFVEDHYMLLNREFDWELKTGDQINDGHCIVRMNNFVFDSTYSKRFFGAELGRVAVDAYEKETTYWDSIRPEPLTSEEQAFIRYQDSVLSYMNSEEYLDSIDSLYNKITIPKLLWIGQGHINRDKKTQWDFAPAINLLEPLAIGGWRISYFARYYKKFENRQHLSIAPFLNYGFRNQDLKGNLFLGYMYDPIHLGIVNVRVGRYFDFVNNFATISDIFRRQNFYVQNYMSFLHVREMFNGFYFRTTAEIIDREDLSDFEFAPIGDSLFENNRPISFENNRTVEFGVGIEYTPKQLYIMEPNEKIVLGSKYPTFNLYYKQAFRNIFGSTNKYSYLDLSMRQLFNVGVFGTSEYLISVGKFFDTTSLQIMDYKYMRGGDPYLFTPAMYTYQMIKQTFPAFDWFFESHYVHQFNGFIGSKIPGMRQLEIKTMGGGGFLYVPERKYQYSELFFGVNRIFRIGREHLRLGLYYVVAQSNTFGVRNSLKVSFEFYNQDKNTWSF